MNISTYKTSSFLFFTLAFFALSISAQNNIEPSCGTITTSESLEYLNGLKTDIKKHEQAFFQIKSTQSKSSIRVTNSIPIKAHVIRNSNGTGGLNNYELNNAIKNLNTIYADAYMEFFLCDSINYIDEDALCHFKKGDENLLTEKHNISGLINIYFTEHIENSDEESICGYSDNVGRNDVIVMKNNCTTNDSSLAHEIGHFFSLTHTHGIDNNSLTTELVDGSNCDTDGDGICDTPADPKLTTSNTDNFCKYIGNQKDSKGNLFTPDTGNIMSYSRKGCRNHFTPQQLARMYAFYLTTKNYLACPSFNANFYTDINETCEESLTVNFTNDCSNITTWEWDMDTDGIIDYTTQNPSHTFNKGIYDVTLTVSNKSKTIKKTFSNLIKVGTESSPLYEDFETFKTLENHGWTSVDASGNGYNWLPNLGKTPSENTGPNDTTKSIYMYAEASGAKPGDVAEFISPCITIDDSNKALKFSYHMFGANMGELHMDIKTNSEYILDVIPALIGKQQLNQDDDFITQTIDLSAYANETIKVRFRAIRGASWNGDIAIDNVFIVNKESNIVNENKSLEIKTYPNPISGDIIYVKTTNSQEPLHYEISNVMGQVLLSGNLTSEEINVSSLKAGSFLLIVKSQHSRVIKKIIK